MAGRSGQQSRTVAAADSPSAGRPASATPRAERAAERRAAILAAALDEFGAHGFAATRLDDVAKRAGIAKGTIYLYFADKNALFRALVESALVPILERMTLPVPVETPTRQLMDSFADAFVAEIYETPRINILRMIIAEGRNFPELVNFYYETVVARGVDAMRALIQRGIDREEITQTAIAKFPQLAIAPALFATVWNGLFAAQSRLDARALLTVQFDLIFAPGENA